MEQASRIVQALRRGGYRPTPSRRLVAGLVAEKMEPFSAADLLEQAKRSRPGVGRATIFRTLEILSSLRVIERLVLPDGSRGYIQCEPDEHHHHLVCTVCGRGVDIADGEIAALVDGIGRRHGYRLESHRLELFGVCPSCAAGETGGATTRPKTQA
jgi:Fur family ferric uptake transcriptional regulator